jgi:nucleotide-binding universal stress UspA family protein
MLTSTFERDQKPMVGGRRTLRVHDWETSIMFQHILLPTDGSPASAAAAQFCMQFAARYGARVTAINVVAPFPLFPFEPIVTDEALQAYVHNRDARAREIMEPLARLASDGKVRFESLIVETDEPYEGILKAARDHQCDLVLMASHGLKGVRGLLLGSQTQKVLTHGTIPVLVWRGAAVP